MPQKNSIGSPLNANSWPSSRTIQRTKLSGPTWQRDGYGALKCLIAKVQLRNTMVPRSDIEKPLTIGLINSWRSRDQIEPSRGRRASRGERVLIKISEFVALLASQALQH